MRNPLLGKPVFMNVIIFLFSGMISLFTLTFGVAHLIEGGKQVIEGNSPNIPLVESIIGSIMVIFLCVIGVSALLLTLAAIQAIVKKYKT